MAYQSHFIMELTYCGMVTFREEDYDVYRDPRSNAVFVEKVSDPEWGKHAGIGRGMAHDRESARKVALEMLSRKTKTANPRTLFSDETPGTIVQIIAYFSAVSF